VIGPLRSKARDLVFYAQLAALQLSNFQIIARRMLLRFVCLLLQRLMPCSSQDNACFCGSRSQYWSKGRLISKRNRTNYPIRVIFYDHR
jgi:hypothetical protein